MESEAHGLTPTNGSRPIQEAGGRSATEIRELFGSVDITTLPRWNTSQGEGESPPRTTIITGGDSSIRNALTFSKLDSSHPHHRETSKVTSDIRTLEAHNSHPSDATNLSHSSLPSRMSPAEWLLLLRATTGALLWGRVATRRGWAISIAIRQHATYDIQSHKVLARTPTICV